MQRRLTWNIIWIRKIRKTLFISHSTTSYERLNIFIIHGTKESPTHVVVVVVIVVVIVIIVIIIVVVVQVVVNTEIQFPTYISGLISEYKLFIFE